jgi:hypothetical protein
MPLNFNVDPYYDDFDPAKNYHRILFKPGFAIQARELTQAQSILQDQVTKFADNIFKQNTPVSGGSTTTNFNCYYIKLQATSSGVPVDVTQFTNKLVINDTGKVVAKVIAVAAATGEEPPTLIVSYKSGVQFQNNDSIFVALTPNITAQAISLNATGLSSVASISQGVFYISSNYKRPSDGLTISNGTFVQVNPQTVIIDKYSNVPSKRIGLTIDETIQDYVGDTSLLDPAIGASNYQAPGADRYLITLTLETRPLTLGDDDGFIELVRIEAGVTNKLVNGTVYNVINDYFAQRDYESNGDYVVNDFKLTPKANTTNPDVYTMSISKGIAYVHGYRVESQVTTDITSPRSRTEQTQNNTPVYMNFGNYFYVDTVRGANGKFFDTTKYAPIDLHCVSTANILTANALVYNSTVVASGYIRGLDFDYNTNDAEANTYVYKAFVSDLQTAVPSANATGGTANSITLPTYFSRATNAYSGVSITLTKGSSAGDSRTIISYNGTTKIATVNQNWTTTPDATTVFNLNFANKDIESIANTSVKTSYPVQIYATASINNLSRANNASTGDTVIQNPLVPELIFPIGNPYVSTVSDSSFTTQQVWRDVTFNPTTGKTISYNADGFEAANIVFFGPISSGLNTSFKKEYFTIIVTSVEAGCIFTVGQNVPWTTAGRTITLNANGKEATLIATDAGGGFNATIIAKVFVSTATDTNKILRRKVLIEANTTNVSVSTTQVATYTFVDDTTTTSKGQVYIQNAGLVTPGTKQSLYLSDVKGIIKILDTRSTGVTPIDGGLSSYADITSNYIFNNGQRDNFYDHASITLRPGASQPVGNILVFLDYYQHSGGDAYFDIDSYTNELYQQIPRYTTSQGVTYNLRDCLDFRPARLNAQTDFTFKYSYVATNNGVFLPIDGTSFITDYDYYLGRKDKLVLTKDRSFQIVEGTPSINPIFPSEPDASLVLANLTHEPYTGYIPTETPEGTVSDLSIEKVKHKRYTMKDIAGLESRINGIEYYASLSMLEQKASSLQISDAYGLNRFKNGIMVDDFSSYAVADTLSDDYKATINKRTRQLTATQNIKNYPLKALALVYNMGMPSTATSSALGYNISQSSFINYFTLPISSTANVATQRFASRTINANPFAYATQSGVLELSPNVDNWVDTSYSPALLITDPNLQIFRATAGEINVLTAGDWQTVSGTTSFGETINTMNHNWSQNWGFGFGVGKSETITSTVTNQVKTDLLGPYSKIDNTYALNNGYITDVSILPFIRTQQVVVRAKNMLFNTPVTTHFDNINVQNYVRKANIIELTNVNGTFNENDIVGYLVGSTFTPRGRVVGVYRYPPVSPSTTPSTSFRLYVAADQFTTDYRPSGNFQNAFFDSNGNYTSNTAFATAIASTSHFGGTIRGGNLTTTVQLSLLASTVDNAYLNQKIYFCDSKGSGNLAADITGYVGSTRTATLSVPVTVSLGNIYSIGSFTTDEAGAFYGVFNLPPNIFHTGERIFRVDNRTGTNDQTTATTFSEGTYYAQGLQTKQQTVDFGASPSGAKGTFTQTSQQTLVNVASIVNPWDPVAQSFIIDGANYRNGVFLSDIKLFFRSKSTENTPITLSIVGTINGYPSGDTLDNSIVTLTPDKVKINENPQYLDPETYTTFKFSAPVYIQPNVLYAFIVKAGTSNEYIMWTANNGDIALPSSVKNQPGDATPTVITKIGGSPYVGGLFVSGNSQTWTADQNQSLMMVINRCVFNTSTSPTIQYVIPKKLPERTLIEQSIAYFQDANSISTTADAVSNTAALVDAFNITTTDFTPTTTNINYTYNATINSSGSAAGIVNISPGKYGTSSIDNLYLNDGKGQRKLDANSFTSFSVYTQLSSNDDAVSPVVSDAGLTTFAINWNINNCSLSNSLIQIQNGGSGYSSNASGNTTVTISAPTGSGGSQAYATANVSDGVIKNIYITTPGAGYITTPTVTISDANTTPGTGASVVVYGETSNSGGPASAKYVTKKVVLNSGFDSGDLNVFLTAYRPVNTNIHVYYKILNRNDTQSFESGKWQLMTKTNASDTLFSQTRSDVYEYTFAPGVDGTEQGYISYTSTTGQIYTSFSQFALKIILTSTDSTFVPFITDMRAIALPENITPA